jgi:glycosyltransferase involved in cell wall biosynthesis/GNAT superfamily N-acetyltransferase
MNGARIAHLTTVDMSLRYLVFPQLLAVREAGGEPIGISAPGPYVSELEAAGIRHIPLASSTRGMNVLADLRAARQLWKVLRREQFDVLHTHNPKPGLYGRVLGRLARVPVVINTVHGLYATPDDPILKRLVVYALEAVASRFSDLELVQSREDFELLTRRRLTRPSRTIHLGNGVDLAHFDSDRFTAADRAAVRSELGAGETTVVVGTVGRLVAEKGYPELFEAARCLDGDVLVVCVGPDDPVKGDALPRDLVAEAAAAGVRFLGMRTDVDRLYAGMDLFVLPTHREGFPRAAMEAAAMGLPIIATDIRGCREVVDDGANGILIPVRNPDALTKTIQRLVDDPVERTRLGEAGRRIALERFDERRVVAKVLRAYVRAGAAVGLDWAGRSDGPVAVRRAGVPDAPALARLHRDGIVTGFLPTLGPRFLEVLYRALCAFPPGVVQVADGGSGPVGFVAGVPDVGSFYRWFVRRYGLQAVLAAAPRVFRPSVMRRAWETLRYDGAGSEVSAELLSIAVDARARGKGIGRRLASRFLVEMEAAGVREVKVVVGSDNAEAIALYRGLGFAAERAVEVHAGEPSVELVWTSQP